MRGCAGERGDVQRGLREHVRTCACPCAPAHLRTIAHLRMPMHDALFAAMRALPEALPLAAVTPGGGRGEGSGAASRRAAGRKLSSTFSRCVTASWRGSRLLASLVLILSTCCHQVRVHARVHGGRPRRRGRGGARPRPPPRAAGGGNRDEIPRGRPRASAHPASRSTSLVCVIPPRVMDGGNKDDRPATERPAWQCGDHTAESRNRPTLEGIRQ